MDTDRPNPDLTNEQVRENIMAQKPPYVCPRCGLFDITVTFTTQGTPRVHSHIRNRGMGRCKGPQNERTKNHRPRGL